MGSAFSCDMSLWRQHFGERIPVISEKGISLQMLYFVVESSERCAIMPYLFLILTFLFFYDLIAFRMFSYNKHKVYYNKGLGGSVNGIGL